MQGQWRQQRMAAVELTEGGYRFAGDSAGEEVQLVAVSWQVDSRVVLEAAASPSDPTLASEHECLGLPSPGECAQRSKRVEPTKEGTVAVAGQVVAGTALVVRTLLDQIVPALPATGGDWVRTG